MSIRYARSRDLPPGAVVGTSSLRREAQLRERYPRLTIEPLRGNVNTRLRKLDEGRYDAIILAAAGLKRLGFGFAHRIAARAGREPARARPGRARHRMPHATAPSSSPRWRALADRATTLATTAERAFSRALGGSCHPPLAAYAEWEEGALWLRGLLASATATTCCAAKWMPTSRMPKARRSSAASSPTTSWRAAPRAFWRRDTIV